LGNGFITNQRFATLGYKRLVDLSQFKDSLVTLENPFTSSVAKAENEILIYMVKIL
jgi:hypothetical protein